MGTCNTCCCCEREATTTVEPQNTRDVAAVDVHPLVSQSSGGAQIYATGPNSFTAFGRGTTKNSVTVARAGAGNPDTDRVYWIETS